MLKTFLVPFALLPQIASASLTPDFGTTPEPRPALQQAVYSQVQGSAGFDRICTLPVDHLASLPNTTRPVFAVAESCRAG